MTLVEGMLEWLNAQIDDEERDARAAVITAHDAPNAYQPHPELSAWRYVPGGEVEYVSTPEMLAQEHHDPYRVTCDSEGILPAVDETVGPHIARQDPASTLARVDAHRAILELHAPRVLPRSHPTHRCQECGDIDEAPVEWPCPTVRHLATAYAGRDGWREEWRA